MRSRWTPALPLGLVICFLTQPTPSQVVLGTPEQALLGVWQLVSAKDVRSGGETLDWLGNTPSGTIIYTAGGRMAVQFMRDPRATFAGGSMWTSDGRDLLASVTPGEIRDAYTGYYAYSGIYTLDVQAHTITHHVQASLRPEEVGRNYVQAVRASGRATRLPISGVCRRWRQENSCNCIYAS